MPIATVTAYFEILAALKDNQNLDVYSAASRAMLTGWTVTPAQMETVVKTYRRCRARMAP